MMFLAALITSLSLAVCPVRAKEGATLKVFAGSASKPALEEIARLYHRKTGVTVELTFGGSGTMLSQMIMAKAGDVYIPGSDDFMDLAEEKGVVKKGSRRVVAYLVPVICVQKGNPKQIKGLEDLTRPGIRVGIGAPKAVCLGDIALEVFKDTGLAKKIAPNVVTHANSCTQVAALVRMKQVDAAIGWDVFAKWSPREIEAVPLPPKVRKYRYVPAAVSRYATDPAAAQRFVEFVCSKEGKAVYAKHGYTVALPAGKLKHHLTGNTIGHK